MWVTTTLSLSSSHWQVVAVVGLFQHCLHYNFYIFPVLQQIFGNCDVEICQCGQETARASKPEDMETKICFGKVIKASFHPLEKSNPAPREGLGQLLGCLANLETTSKLIKGMLTSWPDFVPYIILPEDVLGFTSWFRGWQLIICRPQAPCCPILCDPQLSGGNVCGCCLSLHYSLFSRDLWLFP